MTMPCSGLSANTTASLLPDLKDAMLSFTQALLSVCLWLHKARADGSLKEMARPVIGSALMLWFLSAFVRAYLRCVPLPFAVRLLHLTRGLTITALLSALPFRYRKQVSDASSARLDTLFPTYHILSYIFQTTRWTLGGDWFWTAKYDDSESPSPSVSPLQDHQRLTLGTFICRVQDSRIRHHHHHLVLLAQT